VIAAKIQGDEVITAAYAHELPRYGIKAGFTNYASAYCVGLLCARRLLQKVKLDTKYEGQKEVNGELFEVEEGEGPRPFLCNLDVGLARTTTGARVFAVMKVLYFARNLILILIFLSFPRVVLRSNHLVCGICDNSDVRERKEDRL